MMALPLASSKDVTKLESPSPSQTTLGIPKPIPSIFKARLTRVAQAKKNDLMDNSIDH